MSTDQTFVIIGAGLTGAKAAETLRAEGFAGRVVLVGAETERPYERPPLSKGYLLGREERHQFSVHDEDWYAENLVELRLGCRVDVLDRLGHEVVLGDGERIRYTKALLATGASPRAVKVPGADLDGVLSLRTVTDSDRLRKGLCGGGRVTVVGAGWIGLETAAAAREYGCEVTVIEPQPTPLSAALGAEMGAFFAELHRDHGVEIRFGCAVSEIEGDGGRVVAVITDDGARIPSDVVIVGVGAKPNTRLAERAGLAVDNGVLVDQWLRTEDPDVFAAGDVANAFHPRYGRHLRVEHWANALHGGPAAAKSMLGGDLAYEPIPYFFTDQYDVGMEYTGWFPAGGYDTVVTRGDLPGKAFHAFWLKDARVVAGMHVNLWSDGVGPIEELIRAGIAVDRVRLADTSMPLDSMAGDRRVGREAS